MTDRLFISDIGTDMIKDRKAGAIRGRDGQAKLIHKGEEPQGLKAYCLSAGVGAGITVAEPEKSGRMTWCCGGPVESLYPEKAHNNAIKRVEQLGQAATEVVTMCPMCLINLRNAATPDIALNDLSHYLKRAFVA